jgi:sarcosine oxidase
VIGLAAADALAQAGTEVVCFDPRPGSGQSAGLTRVFRHVHDQPELVALAQEARQLWDEWSRRAATPLVGDEGVLFAGPGVRESAELLTSASVEHRLVGEEEQRELLPALSPPTPAAQVRPCSGRSARRSCAHRAGPAGAYASSLSGCAAAAAESSWFA